MGFPHEISVPTPVVCFRFVCAAPHPQVSAQSVGEQIAIITERANQKSGRFEIGAFFGWVANNPYLTYLPIEGRLAFHFAEGFSFEGTFGYYPPFGSGQNRYSGPLRNRLIEDLRSDPHYVRVEVFEQQELYGHFDLQWTPLYGKIYTEGIKALGHWEIYLQLGAGFIGVLDFENSGSNTNRERNPMRMRPTVNFGAGTRFWLLDWLTLRLDVRHFLFQRQFGNGGVTQNLTVALGLSFVLPSLYRR